MVSGYNNFKSAYRKENIPNFESSQNNKLYSFPIKINILPQEDLTQIVNEV